jgi:TPR repeat protein
MMRKRMRVILLTACVVFAGLTTAIRADAAQDPDVEAALAAARVKAAAGDVVAQFSLGAILYYSGQDPEQAVEWFRRAAAQQYAAAEFQLGQLYDFGLGVSQDDREALAWYRKAAEHGSAAAQRSLGTFYQKGRGIKADLPEAARWYLRGAEGDDIRAQYMLAELYFNGNGLPRDYSAAYFWYSLAAAQAPLMDNRKGLLELRNIAAARMTPAQVAEAEHRVAAWKNSRR